MRKPLALFGAAAAIALCVGAVPFAQSKPSAYLTPPKVIADLMDAEPLPGVSLSPDRTVMLLTHRKSMPSIAEVAAPFYGLGGSRINPKTNGPRLLGATTRLVLRNVSTGVERPLVLPPAVSYSGVF